MHLNLLKYHPLYVDLSTLFVTIGAPRPIIHRFHIILKMIIIITLVPLCFAARKLIIKIKKKIDILSELSVIRNNLGLHYFG